MKYTLIQILVMAAITALLRFFPFLVFPGGRKRPQIITYLGTVLPYGVMAMLVIYCLKGVSLIPWPHGIPELLAVAAGGTAPVEKEYAAEHLRRYGFLYAAGAGCVCVKIIPWKPDGFHGIFVYYRGRWASKMIPPFCGISRSTAKPFFFQKWVDWGLPLSMPS